jgi:hypothetical protein
MLASCRRCRQLAACLAVFVWVKLGPRTRSTRGVRGSHDLRCRAMRCGNATVTMPTFLLPATGLIDSNPSFYNFYSDVPTTTNIEGWGHMSSQALRYRSSSSNREYLGRDVYKSLHVNDLGADYASKKKEYNFFRGEFPITAVFCDMLPLWIPASYQNHTYISEFEYDI